MHYESAFLQLVLRTKAALTDLFVPLGTGVRQQEPPDNDDKNNAYDHHSATERCEIEKCERLVPAEHQRFTDQQIRRRPDQGHQAAKQS